jgi:hypothetical protein
MDGRCAVYLLQNFTRPLHGRRWSREKNKRNNQEAPSSQDAITRPKRTEKAAAYDVNLSSKPTVPFDTVATVDLPRSRHCTRYITLQGHVTRPERSSRSWRLAWHAIIPLAIAALRLDSRTVMQLARATDSANCCPAMDELNHGWSPRAFQHQQ